MESEVPLPGPCQAIPKIGNWGKKNYKQIIYHIAFCITKLHFIRSDCMKKLLYKYVMGFNLCYCIK